MHKTHEVLLGHKRKSIDISKISLIYCFFFIYKHPLFIVNKIHSAAIVKRNQYFGKSFAN